MSDTKERWLTFPLHTGPMPFSIWENRSVGFQPTNPLITRFYETPRGLEALSLHLFLGNCLVNRFSQLIDVIEIVRLTEAW